MEKTTSEWNEGNPLLSSVEAQQKLADVINILGTKVMPYCWKLTGNDPDSLCNLLNVDDLTMESIIRLCGLFRTMSANVYTPKFEEFAMKLNRPNVDWGMFRPAKTTKQVPFLRIGSMERVGEGTKSYSLKAKDQYEKNGVLILLPEDKEHCGSCMIPRNCRHAIRELIAAANYGKNNLSSDDGKENDNAKTPCAKGDRKKLSPTDRILQLVEDEIREAAYTFCGISDHKMSARKKRYVQKTLNMLVKEAASSLLEDVIERLGDEVGLGKKKPQETLEQETSTGSTVMVKQEEMPECTTTSTNTAFVTPVTPETNSACRNINSALD
eukprot:scaffold67100_cov51-Attheya_sp.AAC.1